MVEAAPHALETHCTIGAANDAQQLMAIYERRFSGQVAVITGASSGIGHAVAERLSNEGAKVCGWDLTQSRKDDGAVFACSLTVDVSDPRAVEDAAARTVAVLGNIDILVASAGITGPNVALKDYPTEEWQKVFDVNVNGTFYTNRAIVPYMLKSGYGRIVNIASVAGKEGNPNASAYSASKAAVIAMTKSLGKELAQTGVLVNAVTPAAVRTPIFDQMSSEHISFMLSKIPMGRLGTVTENAALIAWIASRECSFTTGAVFDISGGRATY